jgi:hypothetical protein
MPEGGKKVKKTRSLHLWIGLISSVFILIQSVTGLLISEPWLIGGESRGGFPPGGMPAAMASGAAGTANAGATDAATAASGTAASDANGTAGAAVGTNGNGQAAGATDNSAAQGAAGGFAGDQNGRGMNRDSGSGGEGGGLVGFVKQLHEGMINGTSFKFVVDLTAIAMIILTSTGILLSVRTLRAQSRQRRKMRDAARNAAPASA